MDKTPTRKGTVNWRNKVRQVRQGTKTNDLVETEVRSSGIRTLQEDDPIHRMEEVNQKENGDAHDFDDGSPGITGEFFRNGLTSPSVSWDFIRPEPSESIKLAAKRLGKELLEHKMKRKKFMRPSDCDREEVLTAAGETKQNEEVKMEKYKEYLTKIKHKLQQCPEMVGVQKERSIKRSCEVKSVERGISNAVEKYKNDEIKRSSEITLVKESYVIDDFNDSFDELLASAQDIIDDICKSGSEPSTQGSEDTVLPRSHVRNSRVTESQEIVNPELYDDNDDIFMNFQM